MRAPLHFVLTVLVSLLISGVADANPAGSARAIGEGSTCYLREEDPRTNRPFKSYAEYMSELERWNRMTRPAVGPIDLLTAYQTYRAQRAYADALPNDKTAHCYMGCMIGLATSQKVTDYVGWLKEYQDLTDCDPSTHFEDADWTATSRGARLGARDKTECSGFCVTEFDRAGAHK